MHDPLRQDFRKLALFEDITYHLSLTLVDPMTQPEYEKVRHFAACLRCLMCVVRCS